MIPGQFLTKQIVQKLAVAGLNTYERPRPPSIAGLTTAANRRTIVIPPMMIDINGIGYVISTETSLDLNTAASWDTTSGTDYTVPVTRAGKSFFIYACRPTSGVRPTFKISANSSAPTGYTTTTSRKIAGFDTLPYVTAPTWLANTVTALNYVVQPTSPHANKYIYKCTARSGTYKTHATTEPTWPTTPGQTVVDNEVTWTCMANACMNLPSDHPYKDFEMGSIIFNSIWDLKDMPRSVLREGMVKLSLTPWDGVPNRWCDIYLASGTGTTCTSVHGATIKDTVDWNTFVEYGRLQRKRLLKDWEFQAFAVGSNEETNIAGSADPGIVTFPVDTAGRSMISHYGVIGMCGDMWQWLDEQSYRFDGATNHTHQVTVSGDPQTVTTGNPSGDVAPAWTYKDLPTGVGSIYTQGTYGNVKLLAGGGWDSGSFCGSRSRGANFSRWVAASNVGGRFVAEPQ